VNLEGVSSRIEGKTVVVGAGVAVMAAGASGLSFNSSAPSQMYRWPLM